MLPVLFKYLNSSSRMQEMHSKRPKCQNFLGEHTPENFEMPLSRQLVQIIDRNKFSISFESLCWILRVNLPTRMSQNQAKSNYKGCSFVNRDSFVTGTRLSVLILAKSQAGREFEVLEAVCLVSTGIYIYIYKVGQTSSF